MCFFLGCLLYEFYMKCTDKVQKMYSYFGLITIAVLVLLSIKHSISSVFGKFQLSFILFICPVIIISALNILNKLLSIKPLIFLSKLSMSIYLWHIFIFNIIIKLNITLDLNLSYKSQAFFLCSLALVLFLSATSYYLLEKRFIPWIINKLKMILR